MLSTSTISGHITLEASGLVAVRTAPTGSASFLDSLVLVPGMRRQQCADEINRDEFPITGAMTSGYVFRIENPATVSFLQSIGKAGHLVTAQVSQKSFQNSHPSLKNWIPQSLFVAGVPATVLYLLCLISTVTVSMLLAIIGDWWGCGVIGMFVLARLINVIIIWWRRSLVLVYAAVILAFNALTAGSLLLVCLLLFSVALLTLCNSFTRCLQMYDCVVQREGEPKKYDRRRDMADELVSASKREDWAIGMGLIHPKWSPQSGCCVNCLTLEILRHHESSHLYFLPGEA
ncbi:hypothetical protein DFS33DRAFT_1387225 [Desarmillaria ectypa]|nr:hypothetical protein DFS33DRAFT_1387225 [Desarmillaria ectypa]